jgi:hypothetical protein
MSPHIPTCTKVVPETSHSIVAIHGIGAHPDDTWCKNISTDPQTPRYINWLEHQDMLPSVAPDVRVLRYGYESAWFGDNAISQKVSRVADRLLLALRREREVCAFIATQTSVAETGIL